MRKPKVSTIKKLRQSSSAKAGLIFPVSRVRRYLKQSSSTSLFRQSLGTAVYTAAVLEYLTAELLELAGNAAKALKVKILKPRHLMLAMRQDEELFKLCKDVILPSSGAVPTFFYTKKSRNIVTTSTKQIASTKKTNSKLRGSVKVSAAGRQGAVNASSNSNVTSTLTVLGERTLFLGQKLTVLKTDILNVSADAVVHPTNTTFYTGGQVGRALVGAGGPALVAIINSLLSNHVSLNIGDVVLSDAINLPFKHIVHVNSGAWRDPNPLLTLETVVKKTLELCDEKKLSSVAFPSVGSGQARFPKQAAAETILRTINSYFAAALQSTIKEVYFVLYDEESVQVYNTELQRLV